MIECRGLRKQFGRRVAVSGIDLTVSRDEVLAIAGPNGAGKTTLLRMLATLLRPDAGTLSVGGEPLPDHADAVRRQIGFLGHEPLVYLDLTPLQNLGVFAGLYGLPDDAARDEGVLDRVGLLARAHDSVRTLSRGMTQRLGMARVLLHSPSLLLLDEPYAGLDAEAARVLDAVLSEIGTAVVVTHDVRWAASHADRVMIMNRGQVVETCSSSAYSPDAFESHYRQAVGA